MCQGRLDTTTLGYKDIKSDRAGLSPVKEGEKRKDRQSGGMNWATRGTASAATSGEPTTVD